MLLLKDPFQWIFENETIQPFAPALFLGATLLGVYLFYRGVRYGFIEMWLPGGKKRAKAKRDREREETRARVDQKLNDWKNRTQPLRDIVGNAVKESPPPPRPKLTTDQPWRRPTAFRYLENLKEELTDLEHGLLRTHAEIKKAYENAQNKSPGILMAAAYGIQVTGLKNIASEIEKLTARIENVYRGDVQAEIIQLEIDIQKLERLTPADEVVQHNLIELRGDLKELQSLKTSRIGGATEDDQKMDSAKQRLRRDIHFNVQSRLGKKVNTLSEIQNFEKEQLHSILSDRTLSPAEQEERIELVKQECARMKTELKSPVRIYEDD